MIRNKKSTDLLAREVRDDFLRWKEVPHDLEQLCSNGIAKDATSTEIDDRENHGEKGFHEEHEQIANHNHELQPCDYHTLQQ